MEIRVGVFGAPRCHPGNWVLNLPTKNPRHTRRKVGGPSDSFVGRNINKQVTDIQTALEIEDHNCLKVHGPTL